MKRLNKYFAILLVWVSASLFVIFASGCQSITSKQTKLEPSADEIPFFSMNIGLLEKNERDAKLPFVSIPEGMNLNNNDEVIFLENPILKSQLWVAEGWKNIKRGAVDGAKLGFEFGTFTCAVPAALTAFPVVILAGASGPNAIEGAYKLQVLICGLATGSVGSVSGGALGPAIYPFYKQNDFKNHSFIYQWIVQGTWESLIKMGQAQQPRALQKGGGLSKNNEGYESFEFGSNERPSDRFIQLVPIQFRFIRPPFWAPEAPEQLTLKMVIRMKFLDKNKMELFKERIEINEGPYTLVEWSGKEGEFLNTHMEKAYQKLAEQIVLNLQENTYSESSFTETKASH